VACALEERLRAAGFQPPTEAELGEDARHLALLRANGRAIRIGRSMYAHPDAVSGVAEIVCRVIERDGAVTLAGLRDELSTSRRYAQALLEHLDAARVTRRLPDHRRVLRRGGGDHPTGNQAPNTNRLTSTYRRFISRSPSNRGRGA
jgi:selenocysteine-specific elongation factor